MVVAREYVKGNKKYCAQFNLGRDNFIKIPGTEVEIEEAEREETHVPEFIARACRQGSSAIKK